jgi:tetratricopeptide (TPR) repeat protein
VLARYFQEARGILERHGGTVEKFIGDAVMAVFGVPVAHEDDAVRAVRAAHELRSVMAGLNPVLEQEYGATIELRIGVNTGEVVTGTTERLVTGDAVNVAARLQQTAGPGEIVLGAETLALARDAVTVEALVPVELKGKQEPVPVYRLIGVQRDAPGLARRLDAPIVGRTHERALLEAAFASAVRQGGCALFTLLGPAGVGKSRLVREFLAGVDARVVEGRCLSYGEGITYWPVVEIVKQLGGAAAPELAELPAAAETIEALLGEREIPTTPEDIAWAVRKLLEASARERPLAVVLDDLHWGEPTFFDLVEHIADLSRDAPMLLLCLARPELLERRPGWGGGKLNSTTVLLEPLDAADTGELIERLLGGEALDPELLGRIRAASEGNPLYVEEMLAMVRASGEREVTVPPTIKALLAARLDQLEPAERMVLERGSVEGQLFHSAAVQALGRPPDPVERQLVGLVRKELVRPERAQLPGGDAYRFRHLLIRDAAYDALSKAVRAELHERFADWLAEYGDSLVERDEIVGYHLEQAYSYRVELGPADAGADELARRAAALLAASAHGARVRGDIRAAGGLLARAAELDPRSRPAVLTELGEILQPLGDLPRAVAVLDEALEAARACGDERVEALASTWRAAAAAIGTPETSMEEVIEVADRAAAVLERLGDDAGLAAVLDVSGRHRFFVGRAAEAVEVRGRARERALAAGDLSRAREATMWTFGAMVFGPTSASEMKAFVAQLPEEIAQALDHHPLGALHQFSMHRFDGRFDLARESYATASKRAEELGMRTHLAAMPMFLVLVELADGRPEVAEAALRDGYATLGELGETGFRSTVATLLAEALAVQGKLEEAEEVLATAEALAATDDVDPQVRLRSVRARILARRGDLAGAEQSARDAVEVASRTDYIVLHGDALTVLAEVLEERGAMDEAVAALTEALELFERKQSVVHVEQTRERLRAAATA